MLNNGVIVDSANNTLVDYGLYASGANGTLTSQHQMVTLMTRMHLRRQYLLVAEQLELQ